MQLLVVVEKFRQMHIPVKARKTETVKIIGVFLLFVSFYVPSVEYP
jgi:hypothetical protein